MSGKGHTRRWNTASAEHKDCGGPKPEGGDNRRQPMIGLHKDRGATGASISGRASGHSHDG